MFSSRNISCRRRIAGAKNWPSGGRITARRSKRRVLESSKLRERISIRRWPIRLEYKIRRCGHPVSIVLDCGIDRDVESSSAHCSTVQVISVALQLCFFVLYCVEPAFIVHRLSEVRIAISRDNETRQIYQRSKNAFALSSVETV